MSCGDRRGCYVTAGAVVSFVLQYSPFLPPFFNQPQKKDNWILAWTQGRGRTGHQNILTGACFFWYRPQANRNKTFGLTGQNPCRETSISKQTTLFFKKLEKMWTSCMASAQLRWMLPLRDPSGRGVFLPFSRKFGNFPGLLGRQVFLWALCSPCLVRLILRVTPTLSPPVKTRRCRS